MTATTMEQRYSWKPFLCSYDTPEGKFSLTIHAISPEHAELQVQSIRESLKLDGEISAISYGDKDEAIVRRMTKAEAESQWEEWRCLYRWPDEARTRAAWVASRRELGIVKP